jgi:Flp pilus assembly protein TadD
MRVRVSRSFVAAVCLLGLAGCETTGLKMPDLFGANDPGDTSGSIAKSAASDPETTGSTGVAATDVAAPPPAGPSGEDKALLGANPNDDLSMGKRHFRAQNYGLAERYFRHAVETSPRDSEAWLGLAASYDRLRRFDLADRAYAQLLQIVGPSAEVLNNQGYSYMLRGDYQRARRILLQAKAKSPDNPYVRSNLELLARSEVGRKGIE